MSKHSGEHTAKIEPAVLYSSPCATHGNVYALVFRKRTEVPSRLLIAVRTYENGETLEFVTELFIPNLDICEPYSNGQRSNA